MAFRLSRNMRIGLLGVLVSAFAFAFLARQVNPDLFLQALRTARYEYVVPCMAFLLAGLVTRALRWQGLLSGGLPLKRAFSIMNVAYLVNGVLPLRIGEVARAYLAARADPPVPVMKSASTIIVERLLDLLAVVVMTMLALTAGPVPPEIRFAAGFSAVAALAGFALLVLFASNRQLLHRSLRFFTERFPLLQRFPLQDWLNHFLDGLTPITQPRALVTAVGWTAISWTFSVIAGYVLMFAFFPEASWAATMLYIAAAALAIAVPAVPGNIGTYEASILVALAAFGYEESSAAVAFAVMVHAVNLFNHASTGVIGFIQEGVSLEQLTTGVRQMQVAPEVGHEQA
jgi:uncharacterized protein (TIRG00374 family)